MNTGSLPYDLLTALMHCSLFLLWRQNVSPCAFDKVSFFRIYIMVYCHHQAFIELSWPCKYTWFFNCEYAVPSRPQASARVNPSKDFSPPVCNRTAAILNGAFYKLPAVLHMIGWMWRIKLKVSVPSKSKIANFFERAFFEGCKIILEDSICLFSLIL